MRSSADGNSSVVCGLEGGSRVGPSAVDNVLGNGDSSEQTWRSVLEPRITHVASPSEPVLQLGTHWGELGCVRPTAPQDHHT